MEDEINTAVAEAEPESVDNQNISASDFVQRRSEALLGQQSEEESQEDTPLMHPAVIAGIVAIIIAPLILRFI